MLFKPMDKMEFKAYRDEAIALFQTELVKADLMHGFKAKAQARRQFKRAKKLSGTLPMHIIVGEKRVGHVWFGFNPTADGYIYDIHIIEAHRQKGFAKQALMLVEEKLRKSGVEKIGLHVFGHNKQAQKLYETLGYRPTSVQMQKKLDFRHL